MSKKVSVIEAARILGVTPGLVCRYIREGDLPKEWEAGRTVRGRPGYRIDRKALMEFARIPRKPGPKPQPTA